jgi:predicted CopG family antitoxin
MSKTIRVSEEFHELVSAHKEGDETMEETLRRMVGGPDPRALAAMGLIGSETDEEAAETMREAIEQRRAGASERRKRLRERFESDDSDER